MISSSNSNGQAPRHIVVMGCGRIGASVARSLADEGCTVAIIDINPVTFERLPADAIRDGRIVPIIGDGTREADLRKANIEDCEVFIAVSNRDTKNALSAQMAQHIFDVPTVISRMNDPNRQELYNQLGIKTISGTTLMTEMMLEAAHQDEA